MAEFFRRVEKKYIVNNEQYLALKEIIKNTMVEDEHGENTICNIYLDTKNYDLISHSITKPLFKEKIRLRSYNIPNLDSDVYLEIKRKFDRVVSKRRIGIKLNDYYNLKENILSRNNQVENELSYYFKLYNLEAKMYLSYFRRAYYDKDDKDFRITFDNNILARTFDFELEKGSYGERLLEEDKYIMEVKTLGAMPMWFVRALNDLEIRPCSFSKYGEAYKKLVLNLNMTNEYAHI